MSRHVILDYPPTIKNNRLKCGKFIIENVITEPTNYMDILEERPHKLRGFYLGKWIRKNVGGHFTAWNKDLPDKKFVISTRKYAYFEDPQVLMDFTILECTSLSPHMSVFSKELCQIMRQDKIPCRTSIIVRWIVDLFTYLCPEVDLDPLMHLERYKNIAMLLLSPAASYIIVPIVCQHKIPFIPRNQEGVLKMVIYRMFSWFTQKDIMGILENWDRNRDNIRFVDGDMPSDWHTIAIQKYSL